MKVCYERPVQGHDNQEGINLDIDLPRFVEIDHEPIAGSTTLGENDTTLTETQIPPTGTARVPATRHSTRNRRPPDRYGPFVTSHQLKITVVWTQLYFKGEYCNSCYVYVILVCYKRGCALSLVFSWFSLCVLLVGVFPSIIKSFIIVIRT